MPCGSQVALDMMSDTRYRDQLPGITGIQDAADRYTQGIIVVYRLPKPIPFPNGLGDIEQILSDRT